MVVCVCVCNGKQQSVEEDLQVDQDTWEGDIKNILLLLLLLLLN